MKNRIRQHTWKTKMNIINSKLLPYFKDKKMSEITPKDVIQWQNEMMDYRDPKGKAFAPTYLKTLHNGAKPEVWFAKERTPFGNE